MYRFFFRICGIILINLFAFLLFAVILGALFWNKGQFLIGAVLFSIIPLIIILSREIKKVTQEFNTISKQSKDDRNSK